MDDSATSLRESELIIRIVHVKPFLFFCFDASDVKKLRKRHRIIGQLIGQLPSENLAPKALSLHGLPLLLTPYETYIGIKQGFIHLVTNVAQNQDETISPLNRQLEKQIVIPTSRQQDQFYKYTNVDASALFQCFFDHHEEGNRRNLIFKSFEHFWRNGFVVQTSSHFHTDLVVYTADPLLVHASYLVICVPWKQKMRLRDLMTYSRLASSVKKTLLLVSIKETGDMASQTLNDTNNELFPASPSSSEQAQRLPSNMLEEGLNSTILREEDVVVLLEFKWVGVS